MNEELRKKNLQQLDDVSAIRQAMEGALQDVMRTLNRYRKI